MPTIANLFKIFQQAGNKKYQDRLLTCAEDQAKLQHEVGTQPRNHKR